MNLATRYTPQDTEARWYAHWNTRGYFRSKPDHREPFTIVIPPPNVTGVLHMGHMLNNTIQDILIRRARQTGKNALWVPGTDHASIATEAKVVKMLRERGIKKSDLSRDEFMGYAWEWKEEYGGIILEQLKRLGASCDWERTRFTMEPKLSAAVIRVFIDLYRKGKIYRGLRMINWDPEARTVLSGEEVLFSEENSKLYHVRYRIEGTEDAAAEYITIATTRPETILADTAIAVHPNDERYAHLRGKRAIVPMVERSVPIIFDTYVERDFGTGALKVTPAHDTNDYELGQKYSLEVIDIFTEDAKLNERAGHYVGLDRFVVRKQIAKDLDTLGALVRIEDYRNKVGRSERTNAVIEPRLSLQWFVDMPSLSKPALEAVTGGDIHFAPEHFQNTYKYWMENIRDWCISRQLWWGQRIPAWYDAKGNVYVAETEAEARAEAAAQYGGSLPAGFALRQDEDVLDTWFSSWLWPISVFDGFESTEELKYYYPTNVLVTGFDIIFFWVARMIMAGYEWAGELLAEVAPEKPRYPFKQVYFTGMVRDKFRRKMSKSLGNSPDALALIDTYGADGVRFGMLYCSPAGGDLVFDAPFAEDGKTILNESALCEQGRNFCNKLWNALRLLKGWETTDTAAPNEAAIAVLANQWLSEKFAVMCADLATMYEEFRLSEALKTLYNFVWDDFCSWYLEMIKPAYGQPIPKATLEQAIAHFEKIMVVLHPFMPFITEEIWHGLRERGDGNDCFVQQIPTTASRETINTNLIKHVDTALEVIQKIRELRNKNGISPRETVELYVQQSPAATVFLADAGWKQTVVKLANLSELLATETEPQGTVSFIGGTDNYFAKLSIEVDVEAERERLTKELEYMRGFVESVQKKLGNERFVANAKPDIIANERRKLADGETKIAILEEGLGKL